MGDLSELRHCNPTVWYTTQFREPDEWKTSAVDFYSQNRMLFSAQRLPWNRIPCHGCATAGCTRFRVSTLQSHRCNKATRQRCVGIGRMFANFTDGDRPFVQLRQVPTGHAMHAKKPNWHARLCAGRASTFCKCAHT